MTTLATSTSLEPPPVGTPVVERSGLMQKNWLDWLLITLLGRIARTGFVRAIVALTGQNAAIGATALLAGLAAGVYRVGWYVQLSQVDGVASAVQVSVAYTNLGQALTKSGVNVNGDTLLSNDQGTIEIRVDGNTTIFYSTTYASTTPGQMKYSLDLTCEPLSS